jgi:uncharacterized membrane protein YjfL (UPF0719 family)
MLYNKLTTVLLMMILILLPFFLQADTVSITNPIEYNTFGELFGAVMRFITWLAIFLVPLVVFVAVFQLFGAGDNPEKVKAAKNVLKWAALGLIIVLSSRALYEVIRRVVDREYDESITYNRQIKI